MSKNQKYRRHGCGSLSMSRIGHFEVVSTVIVGAVVKALDQAQTSSIATMMMHPSAAHFWTVVSIAVAGAWIYSAVRGVTRRGHAADQ